ESVVDTKDPNIIYSQWQYGGLVRFDKKTGEAIDIKPQEKDGEPAYKFNWDAPLLISNHLNTRLYFAAQKVFKSDDRGNTWQVISDDLTRKIDRNKLPVMNKVWGMDAVAKNQSTSMYGNITALSESPLNENLLYAGTDDGLFNMTSDGGKNWSKTESFTDISGNVLISNIYASQHNENVVYAVFNNHRSGDFKPYVLKSSDKGKTWTNIGKGLPERGSVYSMAEDHLNANLLFAGTEFGLYFTVDGGGHWVKLSGGLPTTCIKDIAIQKRENDLLVATFGRGFYVLDNYSVLQNVSAAILNDSAYIFPIKNGLVFIPSTPYGHKGKSFQGESFFNTENPPIGAAIEFYIKDEYQTIKDKRKALEAIKVKANEPVYYPSADSMRLEDNEEAPYLVAYILDGSGNVIRKIKSAPKKGLNKLIWNGRMELTSPVSFYRPDPDNPYESEETGPMALPGEYKVYMEIFVNGELKLRTKESKFNLVTLNQSSLSVNQIQLKQFNDRLAETRRVIVGSSDYMGEMRNRLKYIKAGLLMIPSLNTSDATMIKSIEEDLTKLEIAMYGDRSLAKREFETLPGIVGSLEGIVGNLWATTAQGRFPIWTK
ncbi:MAG: glycosyl hydrolase, partial [Bacteroidetes bacterium]|nr:glycosyl hydrolase [Bacteroidota bacterium]